MGLIRWSSLLKSELDYIVRAAENASEAVGHGAQPDFEDEKGCTPLSGAIEGNNATIVQLLLAQGVNWTINVEM